MVMLTSLDCIPKRKVPQQELFHNTPQLHRQLSVVIVRFGGKKLMLAASGTRNKPKGKERRILPKKLKARTIWCSALTDAETEKMELMGMMAPLPKYTNYWSAFASAAYRSACCYCPLNSARHLLKPSRHRCRVPQVQAAAVKFQRDLHRNLCVFLRAKQSASRSRSTIFLLLELDGWIPYYLK